MAKRITDVQIKQINEVYYRCKNKAQTARVVGVSTASVSKYIISNYTPEENRNYTKTSIQPKDFNMFLERFKEDFTDGFLMEQKILSKEELNEINEIRKEIYI